MIFPTWTNTVDLVEGKLVFGRTPRDHPEIGMLLDKAQEMFIEFFAASRGARPDFLLNPYRFYLMFVYGHDVRTPDEAILAYHHLALRPALVQKCHELFVKGAMPQARLLVTASSVNLGAPVIGKHMCPEIVEIILDQTSARLPSWSAKIRGERTAISILSDLRAGALCLGDESSTPTHSLLMTFMNLCNLVFQIPTTRPTNVQYVMTVLIAEYSYYTACMRTMQSNHSEQIWLLHANKPPLIQELIAVGEDCYANFARALPSAKMHVILHSHCGSVRLKLVPTKINIPLPTPQITLIPPQAPQTAWRHNPYTGLRERVSAPPRASPTPASILPAPKMPCFTQFHMAPQRV
jgi:hypothetical protein